jgi:hypothetical protein
MRPLLVVAPVMVLGLAIGCGGSSTTAPSTVAPSAGVNPDAVQGIVGATVTQATGMLVSAAPGGLSRVMTPSPPSITSSGTVTWEQPLGTVTVRPCGP